MSANQPCLMPSPKRQMHRRRTTLFVPSSRMSGMSIAEIGKSAQKIPARMNFVDIAGLVKGASKGEGLGNQFLGNIRETDAVIYVLRCFENDDITHVDGRIDPMADYETVETELMLSDLESLEKRKSGLEKKIKQNDKDALQTMLLIELAIARRAIRDYFSPDRI